MILPPILFRRQLNFPFFLRPRNRIAHRVLQCLFQASVTAATLCDAVFLLTIFVPKDGKGDECIFETISR
jgi:hypothetical protein